MPKQAKRRFVGLDTAEVSLVDTPANEVEFLVTKNQEDEEMGAQAAQTTNDGAVRVPVEVDGGESVAKAMEHVNGIVGNIMKLVAKNADGDNATDDGDATATDDVDTEKATIKSVLAACGLTGKAMDEAMAKLKKAGFDPNMKFPSAKAPVAKAADDDADQDAANADEPISVVDMPLTIGAIQKAAAFTPTRITQLKTAVDTLKLILESIGVGQAPSTRVPGVETHPNPNMTRQATVGTDKKPVMKSADGGGNEVLEVLKTLGDAVGKLNERIEGIEKARQGSNSVEDDAGGNDTDSTQTTKSLWSGVL